MTTNDIIRALAETELRSDLEAQGTEIPVNTTDDSLLTDADLDSVQGGGRLAVRAVLALAYGVLGGGNTVLTTQVP